MMKKMCCLALVILLSGCVTMPPIENHTDLSSVDFAQINKFKRGESCTTFLLGLIPFGSTRITSAVKDARIRKLKIAEYEMRNYVVITQSCLIVYGI